MEVRTMRLGKEQAAGYVEDLESDVTEQVTVPAAAVAAEPEPVIAAEEPVSATR
jgi:hypothetical protein